MSGNTRIMKGEILRKADEDLESPTAEILDNLLDNDLWQAGRNRPVLKAGDEAHVKDDWFGTNWWPNALLKEQVLRTAYAKAIQMALSDAKVRPVVSLWISGMTETFEAAVMDSPQQITVVLLTPKHPETELPDVTEVFPDTVYAVAPASAIDDIRASYQGKYQLEAAEEPIPGNGVKVQRLIGY